MRVGIISCMNRTHCKIQCLLRHWSHSATGTVNTIVSGVKSRRGVTKDAGNSGSDELESRVASCYKPSSTIEVKESKIYGVQSTTSYFVQYH